jgi:hypothetical protein
MAEIHEGDRSARAPVRISSPGTALDRLLRPSLGESGRVAPVEPAWHPEVPGPNGDGITGHDKIRSWFPPVQVIDLPQAASVPGRLFKTTLLLPFLEAALAQGVVVDRWTNENGLPVKSVRGICQGPEGYLWLATYDGLVRFDGVRFVTFNKSNSDGILSDRFFGMVCGSGGRPSTISLLRNGGFWA